jgi:hypothetical protein
MKASEMIYRLARAIQENGDFKLKLAVEGYAAQQGETTIEGEVKCLDVHEDYFEIYGEEK